jgi:uncharacterized protein YegP (UPF0339 family)
MVAGTTCGHSVEISILVFAEILNIFFHFFLPAFGGLQEHGNRCCRHATGLSSFLRSQGKGCTDFACYRVTAHTTNKPAGGFTVAAGTFELKTGTNGQFHFVLKASNGLVIARSRMYKTRDGALKGIESVRKHAPDAKVVDGTA